MEKKKVIVGLSGGVDSSVSLLLLKKQGFSPIGLTLRFPVWEGFSSMRQENICCTAEGIRWVKKLCLKLEVPYYVLDYQEEFKRTVLDYFVKEYKKGKTPNPCMVCNKYLRFPKFFEFAKKMKADFVATGHYARLRREIRNPKSENRKLLMAKDQKKDQSYFLALLSQKELSQMIFPLGGYTKKEVYGIAKKAGFEPLAQRPESQDFCFVAGKSKNFFLEQEIGLKPGPILNKEGKVLGKHKGLYFYTIGQRKGIEFSGGPYYVLKKDSKNNALIVTKKEKDLHQKELKVIDVNWISGKEPELPLKVKVKIRYGHQPASATLTSLKSSTYQLKFTRPQRAITPGQFAVFYVPSVALAKLSKGEVCLGGGVITS